MSSTAASEIVLSDVAKVIEEIGAHTQEELLTSDQLSNNVSKESATESPIKGANTSPQCENSTAPETSPKKPRRRRRHVRFADDDGRELFSSRECPPSDVPPDLDVKAILKEDYVEPAAFFSMGLSMRPEIPKKAPGKWAYKEETQPIDDYCTFAKTIEEQLILAENIFISQDKLICTIKVKCVRQVSRVFARITFNNWISFSDIDCKLIPLAGMANSPFVAILYQRYCFERELPPVSTAPVILGQNMIMFAFCAEFEGGEQRWDNHFGRNYCIEIVPCDPNDGVEQPTIRPIGNDTHSFFGQPAPKQVVNREEERYKSRIRAMSPEYTYYNESSEFYW